MRIPLSTYRLQLNPAFGFQAAKEIVPYLAELGISDIYASPVFKARRGSLHGYDVVDPNQLNPELGSVEDFNELLGETKKYRIGWLQDVVPNHMAYDGQNKMLMDVLENGPDSEYFGFFDVQWDHPYESIGGRILAPFLGEFYGVCLDNREIQLRYDQTGLTINYYNLSFPVRIETYTKVFTHNLSRLKRTLGHHDPDFVKLLGVLYGLKNLPPKEESQERYDQVMFVKRMLWELYAGNPEVKRFVDKNIEVFNGEKGHPESFHLLHELLSEQFFRLSFWKVGTEEINYRRFFNINGLISLRMEDEHVFDHTHALIFDLVRWGKITGLRIDHVDGLYNPSQYLKRLREKAGEVYLVVEKILDLDEGLSASWPVQGTTGYDFLNYVNGLFCERRNESTFGKIYRRFTGFETPYNELVTEKKRLIIGKEMAGDVDNLAHLMARISSHYRYGSDFTMYGLKRALVEVLALFPVYRTYISEELVTETDRALIREVIKNARENLPDLIHELRFLERLLLFQVEDSLREEERQPWLHFVMKFQQFTGPLMAKGFEDTVLYIYNRLLPLNEVGSSPNHFGISVDAFHRFNTNRAQLWPHSLTATSTHDTKRGEDVRARIHVLSEMPEEWASHLKTWNKLNRRKKRLVDGRRVPDRNDEYFLYQTLIGAWPFQESEYPAFRERIKNYLIKAVREAKVHTAWLKPDTDYEEAFISFTERILDPSEENQFLKAFLPVQRKVAHYGILNSLSQTLIKITSPGVPDFYQGTELWDLNLVDPDNRRPVDFERREQFLQEIKDKTQRDVLNLITELFSTREDGRIKLFLIYRALVARRREREVFQNGAYIPIEVDGQFKDQVVAFARNRGNTWAIIIVPRLLTAVVEEGQYPLGQVWSDTHIRVPEGRSSSWEDAITGQGIEGKGTILVSEALKHFPVASLITEAKE